MINPNTLKFHRERMRLTQRQLEAKSGVNNITISRIEQGKVKRPNSSTVQRLATALAVEPDKLSEPPAINKPKQSGEDSRYETPLRDSTRNALALVARRYGMKPRVILELAPAMFVLAAERHLSERKSHYWEMEAAIEQANSRCPKYLNLFGVRPEDALGLEWQALKERDLFLDSRSDPDDIYCYGYEFESHAPFPNWLNQQLMSVGYEGSIDWWNRDEPPGFQLDLEDVLWLTNGDQELAGYIATGHVPLHKLQGEERSNPTRRLEALHRLKQANDQDELDIDAILTEMLDKTSGNEEQIG